LAFIERKKTFRKTCQHFIFSHHAKRHKGFAAMISCDFFDEIMAVMHFLNILYIYGLTQRKQFATIPVQ